MSEALKTGRHRPAWFAAPRFSAPDVGLTRARYLSSVVVVAEFAAILGFAAWFARPYLNLNPYIWPAGTGMGGKLIGHYFWVNLKACGLCALWSDSMNGGVPALADRFGSQLHPLVALTTLLWGVIAGAKLSTIGVLAIAGLAQWWIGRTLRVGLVARLWSAGLAIAGGHLASTQDEGSFGILLSTAMASLALAAALSLGVRRRRRDAVVLGVVGALTVLSGQGYVQLALLACAPAFLFFILDERWHWSRLWREYALAVGICILLLGIWLVPMAHFWPNYTKDLADPAFGFAQPLEYSPLNLVIHDRAFYRLAVLGRQVNTNILYIGWVPVIAALLCLRFARRQDQRALLCLVTAAALVFVLAGGTPLRLLSRWAPFFFSFRFVTLMTGMAIPALLGLAAYGMDTLIRLPWPRLGFFFLRGQESRQMSFSLSLAIVVLMLLSLRSTYDFSKDFYYTRDMGKLHDVLEQWQTPTRQWVATPYGEWDWVQPAIGVGLKLTNFSYSGAGWNGREFARPYEVLERGGPPAGSVAVGDIAGVPLYRIPANQYAYIDQGNGMIAPCQAAGRGGDITVECTSDRGGRLIVQENAWDGWYALRDQVALAVGRTTGPAGWLDVDAPAGTHQYSFRYRPWDVWAGLGITLAGALAAIVLWLRSPAAENNAQAELN